MSTVNGRDSALTDASGAGIMILFAFLLALPLLTLTPPQPLEKAPVRKTGALRPPLRAPDRSAPRVLNAGLDREVDVSTYEKSRDGQSLAAILIDEKNRCLPISAPSACAATIRGGFSELSGTISGTI